MTELSQSNREFIVLQVEVNDGGLESTWSNWLPVARVEAVSAHAAIKKVAKQLGDGVAVAVPLEALTVRRTWVVRATHSRQAEPELELIAPELLPEPEPSEPEEVAEDAA